ncbi:hypothetical protein GCM10023340_38930 [Nocardioides marinquilinus]|uniref:Uncharacterized protein n=1 Tax=Nocardioides marinquilinus TaxID=1210400 RepID=A0ABP9Q040_9ACTN
MSRLSELNAYEVAQAERAAGMSYDSLFDDDAPKVGLMGALAWQFERRTQPALEYDDYLRTVKTGEIRRFLLEDDAEPEPEPEPEPVTEAATFPAGDQVVVDGAGTVLAPATGDDVVVAPTVDAADGAGGAEGERLPGAEGPAV